MPWVEEHQLRRWMSRHRGLAQHLSGRHLGVARVAFRVPDFLEDDHILSMTLVMN